jgi:DNA-binding MarR family transcriptional regulator
MTIMDLALTLESFGFGFGQLTYELLDEIQPAGITPLQFKILQYLSRGESITLSQISICLGMTVPNTSREVKKLLAKNLLQKTPDEQDHRVSFITLSPTGVDLMTQTFAKLKKNISIRYAHLDAGEIEKVVKALGVISEKLLP